MMDVLPCSIMVYGKIVSLYEVPSFQLSYSSYIMLFFVVAIAIYLLGHITKQHPANLFLVDNQMSEIDRKVLALT
jgi:amino acid permease